MERTRQFVLTELVYTMVSLVALAVPRVQKICITENERRGPVRVPLRWAPVGVNLY